MDWVWQLTDKQLEAFYEALNEPDRPTPKLDALMNRPTIFDDEV